MLVFQEQECFQEELRRAQRKLLKVSRDKRWLYCVCLKMCWWVHKLTFRVFTSFLLDRLLQYERVDEDSTGIYCTSPETLLWRIQCLLNVHFLKYNSKLSVRCVIFLDSDATISSENSEGEVLREREREREAAKKYVLYFNIKFRK